MAGLTYWDYIKLDTLLSLQQAANIDSNSNPEYPDEIIFITYHQICELYFKLIVQEIRLIQTNPNDFLNWNKRLQRIINYFHILHTGFKVITPDGLDTEEFYLFREKLSPSSGFQTHQFRVIEIMFTDLINLIMDKENINEKSDLMHLYENIYWKQGALNKNGNKTELLLNFENKYDELFINLVLEQKEQNLFHLFNNISIDNPRHKDIIHLKLMHLDNLICDWKYEHFDTVVKHFAKFRELDAKHQLHKESNTGEIKGTGETNSHEFLTKSIKVIRYFPL